MKLSLFFALFIFSGQVLAQKAQGHKHANPFQETSPQVFSRELYALLLRHYRLNAEKGFVERKISENHLKEDLMALMEKDPIVSKANSKDIRDFIKNWNTIPRSGDGNEFLMRPPKFFDSYTYRWEKQISSSGRRCIEFKNALWFKEVSKEICLHYDKHPDISP